jgi:uncharacterized RDD family membrane protein YckC
MKHQADVHYAGFLRRAAAFILDKFMLSTVFVLLLMMIFYVSPTTVSYLLQSTDPVNLPMFLHMYNTGTNSNQDLAEIFLIAVVTVFFWRRYLATPGKMLMNCQVVDARSLQRVTTLQAALRFIGYFASFLTLGLGFLWVLYHPRKQGFHDLLARTVVIQVTDELSQQSLTQLAGELH